MAKRVKRSKEISQNKRRKEEDAKLESVFGKVKQDVGEEEDYELQPRHFKQVDDDVVEALPIVTADGTVERVMKKRVDSKKAAAEAEAAEASSDSSDEEDSDAEASEDASEKQKRLDEDTKYSAMTPTEKLLDVKEEMASIADKLMQDPEEHVLLLAKAMRMCLSDDPVVSQLSILSMVPVFKSIAPSYRIRPLTEAEEQTKVTRDVARTRFFEQNLVSYYKKYVDLLSQKGMKFSFSPNASELDKQLGIVAANAACELATSLRFFNYRTDLFKILIRRVMKRPANEKESAVFKRCIQTLEELLVEDVDAGDVSFDVVRFMCRAIRHREFKVEESVINVFLSLTVLGDYDPFASEEEKEEKARLRKKDRVHLSKKQRKQLKERRQIEKEMRAAEQKVTAEERERNQAQVLKFLLTLYLQALKARPEKLMAPVLEGLAKYGHQVNLDLMGDFLQVLREITEELQDPERASRNTTRQILLCIITSFSLVKHMPGKRVHLDLNKFVDYLYTLLPSLSQDAEIEFSHKTLRLMDPLSQQLQLKPSVNVSTDAELLLRCLNAIFFNSRSGSEARALAFTKRLYLDALHFPEKTVTATFKFIDKLLSRYDEVRCLYTTEDRVENGVYHAEADSVERANTEVAVLWENALLQNHYNPTIAQASKALFNRAKGKGVM